MQFRMDGLLAITVLLAQVSLMGAKVSFILRLRIPQYYTDSCGYPVSPMTREKYN